MAWIKKAIGFLSTDRKAAKAKILNELSCGEKVGRDLRWALRERGLRVSAPEFYSIMAEMEQSGQVKKREARVNTSLGGVTLNLYRLA